MERKSPDSRTHYVYYLHGQDGRLLYVGRTLNLKRRRKAFEVRTGLSVSQTSIVCASFAEAQAMELAEIARLWPPYNKRLASGIGLLGLTLSEDARRRISARGRSQANIDALRKANTGRALTEKQRAALRQHGKPMLPHVRVALLKANLGRKLSTAHREALSRSGRGRVRGADERKKISDSLMGHGFSDETRRKISASLTGKQQSVETIERRVAKLRGKSRPDIPLGASGVRGVFWEKHVSKWRVRIFMDGEKISLGMFATVGEAATAIEQYKTYRAAAASRANLRG